jgi:uncharacterized membrane protein YpjA
VVLTGGGAQNQRAILMSDYNRYMLVTVAVIAVIGGILFYIVYGGDLGTAPTQTQQQTPATK